MKFTKLSVVESAAIVAAQEVVLAERGYLPTPAWSKIVSLAVVPDGAAAPGCSPENPCEEGECGSCAYSCRRGDAEVVVGFRNAPRFRVRLRGFESDPRLGVSIDKEVEVQEVPRKKRGLRG